MDCPGGLKALSLAYHLRLASTLVLMDCPGGLRARRRPPYRRLLQPLF